MAHNVGDTLTYWIYDDQMKRLLARSVVRPYSGNRRVKWEPSLVHYKDYYTANIGNDKYPPKDVLESKMQSLEDEFDKAEPAPEPAFLDAHMELHQSNNKELSPALKPSRYKTLPSDFYEDPGPDTSQRVMLQVETPDVLQNQTFLSLSWTFLYRKWTN